MFSFNCKLSHRWHPTADHSPITLHPSNMYQLKEIESQNELFTSYIKTFYVYQRTILRLMIVGFTTTYAVSDYHQSSCEFESHSGEVYSTQHYVIKYVSDLRQFDGFLLILRYPPPIKLAATIQLTELLFLQPMKLQVFL